MKYFLLLLLPFFAVSIHCPAQDTRQIIPFPSAPGKDVDAATMQSIYAQVKTPYKYGVIIKGDPGELVDSPSVFRYQGSWYMVYIKTKDNVGYQTYLASSDDLLHWKTLGAILPFPGNPEWDRWQASGGNPLRDCDWPGTNELQQYDAKYWLSYCGGSLQGYETDPLSIGLAWTFSPDDPVPWHRLESNPVLTHAQPDARDFEKATLYKSCIVWDKKESLGYPFVMFYNGKKFDGFERIGMAVSKNMVDWKRYGDKPVVANGEEKPGGGISGDPQVVKIGDLWVMFYFGAFWEPGAFDTFACSYDLVHWTKWSGEKLIKSSEPYDQQYAHKPFILSYKGIVYHFYCAVGDQGRVIALATSQPMTNSPDSKNSSVK